jgi:quercetin dioxygenase-like cupin family protein
MTQTSRRDVTTYRWNDIPEEPLKELLSRKFISCDRVMISQLFLKKGCTVPAHSHENEQVSYVLKGALKFTVNGKDIVLSEGEVMHIPSNVVHSAVALEDTLDLDVFSPPRQDWLEKTDDYLRGK